MTENDFFDSIDCKFPYDDMNKSIELFKIASNISDNAVYWLLLESVDIPYNLRNSVDKLKIKNFLNHVLENYNHKLLKDIIEVSINVIDDIKNDEIHILNLMEELKEFDWLYCALNILYLSLDDKYWILEEKYNEIRNIWDNN